MSTFFYIELNDELFKMALNEGGKSNLNKDNYQQRPRLKALILETVAEKVNFSYKIKQTQKTQLDELCFFHAQKVYKPIQE